MLIRILGCHGGGGKERGLTSFLINDSICIDAGNITGFLDIEEQRKIENIIISHTHLDHIRDLPLLADNLIEMEGKSINVFSHKYVLEALKNNFFNNIIFPDFAVIPEKHPIIHYHEIKEDEVFKISGLNIKGIFVNHTVPNMGYLIDDGEKGFAFISDTYQTEKIYIKINENLKIKFVIMEVSFPNEKEEIAKISKHLTPNLLENELKKLREDLKVYIYHLKPSYENKIIEEIQKISTDKDLEFLKDGMIIEL